MKIYIIQCLKNEDNIKLLSERGVRESIKKRKVNPFVIFETSFIEGTNSKPRGYIIKSTLDHPNDMYLSRGLILETLATHQTISSFLYNHTALFYKHMSQCEKTIQKMGHNNFEIVPVYVTTEKKPEDFNRYIHLMKPAEKLLLHPQLEYDEKMIVKNMIDALTKEGI